MAKFSQVHIPHLYPITRELYAEYKQNLNIYRKQTERKIGLNTRIKILGHQIFVNIKSIARNIKHLPQ